MFTVEFEPDASIITSIDETDTYHDVEMIIGDDGGVFIRQFTDEMEEYQLIYISYQQLLDLMSSLKQTEGAYYLKTRT
jgi:hypothetical protein